MFYLCFLGSKSLMNLRRQFRVRKIFSRWQLRTQVFAGFAVFSFVFGTIISKYVTYVLDCSIKVQ